MRIYPTLVLKNTLMAKWFEDGEYLPQTVEEAAAECAELLDIFELYKINVIRLGLHAEGSLEENLLAGPYHPAFREICESLRFRKKIAPMLTRLPKGSYVLKVAPSEVSKCSGQKRSNIEYWQNLGYEIILSMVYNTISIHNLPPQIINKGFGDCDVLSLLLVLVLAGTRRGRSFAIKYHIVLSAFVILGHWINLVSSSSLGLPFAPSMLLNYSTLYPICQALFQLFSKFFY